MNHKEIVTVFTRKSGLTNTSGRDDIKYHNYNVAYLLYSDYTWEQFLVYEGLYYFAPQNGKANITSRLKGKTRSQAIVIIEKLINEGKIIGTLLV